MTCLIHTCDLTRSSVAGITARCVLEAKGSAVMGWLRLVGSLKVQVFFAEYSLFYRALLQKRPIILRSLLIVGTPYIIKCSYIVKKPQLSLRWSHICICSLKVQVFFAEYRLFYRALLQKRPIILRSPEKAAPLASLVAYMYMYMYIYIWVVRATRRDDNVTTLEVD